MSKDDEVRELKQKVSDLEEQITKHQKQVSEWNEERLDQIREEGKKKYERS